MNYIVLDLEWNQAAYKSDEEENLPFEIIEIGAVKLDKNGNKLDEYSVLIRPQVYPFLLRRTREITGLTDRDLDEKGVYFDEVCPQFLDWCGRDYIFCIWGPSDLTQLERNMAYYHLKMPWKYPFKYLDVQKLFAMQENEGKVRRQLEHAIEYYGLPKDRPFHRAVDDAAYTALIFQQIDRKKYESYFSVDYYRLPKNFWEEKTFKFETYSKYVTREFNRKEELLENRKVKETPCLYCRRAMTREVPWFTDGSKNYFCLARCKEHGLMRGRIRIKSAEDYTGVFGVRTINPCTPEEEQALLKKKDALKIRRKERRKRVNEREKAERAERRAVEGNASHKSGSHKRRSNPNKNQTTAE